MLLRNKSTFVKDTDLSLCIPLLFHGDDADSHRRRTFYSCTVSSPLCEPGDTFDSRLLLCTVDNKVATPELFDTIDTWLVHGFTELQEGEWLTVDPWNNPITPKKDGRIIGKYRAILAGFKGDEKYVQRALKLKASWIGTDGVCAYCGATNNGPLGYCHFGPQAPHRDTLVSNEKFFLEGCKANAWLRLPGFALERVFLDWLHLVDLALTPEASASEPQHLLRKLLVWESLNYIFLRRSALSTSSSPCLPSGFDRAHKDQHGMGGGIIRWAIAFGLCPVHPTMQTTWCERPVCNCHDVWNVWKRWGQETVASASVCLLFENINWVPLKLSYLTCAEETTFPFGERQLSNPGSETLQWRWNLVSNVSIGFVLVLGNLGIFQGSGSAGYLA